MLASAGRWGAMMAGPTYGAYNSKETDSQNLGIGIAVMSIAVAFVSLTTPFLLYLLLQLLGLGFAQPIIVIGIVSTLVLPIAWLIFVIWGMRALGHRGLWLLVAAPVALAPLWFPAVPGLCYSLICTYVKLGPLGFEPPPSMPVYSAPPPKEAIPALATIETGAS
jgi:hypothetical protein